MGDLSPQHSEKIRTMTVVLLVGIALMVLKFVAYGYTSSGAVLTDAVESIVNVLAGSFALYSLYYAARPKDEDHPYGHGKIEFLSTGVEGGMVFAAGLAMMVQGALSFVKPHTIQNISLGFILTVVSGAVNFLLAGILMRKGKRLHSSSMIADGKHLLTDTLSSAGVLLGLLLIWLTGYFWVDYVITVILGGFIAYTGFHLIREAVTNLLDKADYGKIEHLIEVLNAKRKESWIDIHNLRVVKYGSVVHVDCHMTLPWYFTLEEAHAEVDAVDKLATAEFSHEIEFFIHSDPCIPTSCSVCLMHQCQVRQHALVKRLEWDMSNVLPDKKHSAE